MGIAERIKKDAEATGLFRRCREDGLHSGLARDSEGRLYCYVYRGAGFAFPYSVVVDGIATFHTRSKFRGKYTPTINHREKI